MAAGLGIPVTATDQPGSPGHSTPGGTAALRVVAPEQVTADNLGPLQDLPGFWQGTGFGLVAKPDRASPTGVFLQLNILQETIEFTPIGSPVPDRGSVQNNIAIFGVTYLHRVTDATTGGALHIEPGMWINVPATTDPPAGATVARLFTVPHGNAVCAPGVFNDADVNGIPTLPSISTVPFPLGTTPPPTRPAGQFPEYDLSTPTEFRTHPLPAAITQAMVDDPVEALRAALAPLQLTHVTSLIVSSDEGGGIANIPFITANANAPQVNATFAIETVAGPFGPYLQLQYSQSTELQFGGISYPHVTVGTLIKAF